MVEVHLVALRDPAGPAGLVAVFHDLTERRRTEVVRRDFVANVSHELRTPLAAVRGAAETLLGGALGRPEAAHRFAEMILRQAVRLQALTDDLLSLARLEWEGTKLEIQPIPAEDLIEAVLAALDEPAAARQVVLEGQAVQPEATLQADRAKLEQALVNLVDNAVKYSRPGGVVVLRVEVQPGQARLSVADQGVGIPAEDLERIFERFYRVDQDRSRSAGGTGLGLAIVKHVAQLHGGRVEVASILGQGSTFTLVLPQAGSSLPDQPASG
jgi:two-component system phosphate regulon sensor histidine kinase PhoR